MVNTGLLALPGVVVVIIVAATGVVLLGGIGLIVGLAVGLSGDSTTAASDATSVSVDGGWTDVTVDATQSSARMSVFNFQSPVQRSSIINGTDIADQLMDCNGISVNMQTFMTVGKAAMAKISPIGDAIQVQTAQFACINNELQFGGVKLYIKSGNSSCYGIGLQGNCTPGGYAINQTHYNTLLGVFSNSINNLVISGVPMKANVSSLQVEVIGYYYSFITQLVQKLEGCIYNLLASTCVACSGCETFNILAFIESLKPIITTITIPSEPPTFPTTIPTIPSEPPTIPTTIPTIPSEPPTIPTTIPTIPSEPPTIPTTIPTIPSEPPTIPTTIPTIPSEPPTLPTIIPTIPEKATTFPTITPTIPEKASEFPTIIPTIPEKPTTFPTIIPTIPEKPTPKEVVTDDIVTDEDEMVTDIDQAVFLMGFTEMGIEYTTELPLYDVFDEKSDSENICSPSGYPDIIV